MSAPVAPHIGYPWDMIIRAAKKVNIHKRFWLSTLVFFRLARRTNILKGRIATRRAPGRGSMTLSWISRRNGDSFEPPWVDLIFPCPSASERRIRKISPTQLETVVTVHDPQYYTRAGQGGDRRGDIMSVLACKAGRF